MDDLLVHVNFLVQYVLYVILNKLKHVDLIGLVIVLSVLLVIVKDLSKKRNVPMNKL